jgi:hypothetical protein
MPQPAPDRMATQARLPPESLEDTLTKPGTSWQDGAAAVWAGVGQAVGSGTTDPRGAGAGRHRSRPALEDLDFDLGSSGKPGQRPGASRRMLTLRPRSPSPNPQHGTRSILTSKRRCRMDALPIDDEHDVPVWSTTPVRSRSPCWSRQARAERGRDTRAEFEFDLRSEPATDEPLGTWRRLRRPLKPEGPSKGSSTVPKRWNSMSALTESTVLGEAMQHPGLRHVLDLPRSRTGGDSGRWRDAFRDGCARLLLRSGPGRHGGQSRFCDGADRYRVNPAFGFADGAGRPDRDQLQ